MDPFKGVNVAKPAGGYPGQCQHLWAQSTLNAGICIDCGATCERDERGKISSYQAIELREIDRMKNKPTNARRGARR